MALKDLVLTKAEKAKLPRTPKPAKKLPAVKDATLTDIHNEVAAAAEWAKRMGYREVGPRLEWAANALMFSDKLL
jgi:hypothetical protein